MQKHKLEWEEKYSVKVKEIDDQHKKMFDTINRLIDMLDRKPTKEDLNGIIASLIEYKKFHFLTEERYFDKFHYSGTEEHKKAHLVFTQKLEELVKLSDEDTMIFAFKLIDFLEDWLIDHLMIQDQKYVACFQEYGLK